MKTSTFTGLNALIAAGCLLASPALAATASKGTNTAGNAAEAGEATPLSAGGASERKVEVVVVRGFRVRAQGFDERRPPLIAGYGELIKKPECQTNVCGYVVFHDGTRWRYTSILAGEEEELRDMQANLEYDRQTLVIVHPNGENRRIPEF